MRLLRMKSLKRFVVLARCVELGNNYYRPTDLGFVILMQAI